MSNSTILWLRLDLRLADNPALFEAVQRGSGVIPVFAHGNAKVTGRARFNHPWPGCRARRPCERKQVDRTMNGLRPKGRSAPPHRVDEGG